MKIILVALTLALLGGIAAADEAAPADYRSPFRDTWRDEVKKDPNLKADIEKAMRLSVHEEESKTFTRNNEHVVMAYIAIWVLTAGFVLMTFLRQQKLKGEIAALHQALARATKDDGK